MAIQLQQLLARRQELAEASTRALAHRNPNADQLGEALGDIEALIEQTDVVTFDRLLGTWLEEDQVRLQAHLSNEAVDCLHCSLARQQARAS